MPKNELADSLSCSLSVRLHRCVLHRHYVVSLFIPPVHVSSSTSHFKFEGGSTNLTASVRFKGLHSAMRSSCTFAETLVKSSLLCCNNIIKKHICNVFIASILYMSVLGSSFCHLMVKRRDNVEKSTDWSNTLLPLSPLGWKFPSSTSLLLWFKSHVHAKDSTVLSKSSQVRITPNFAVVETNRLRLGWHDVSLYCERWSAPHASMGKREWIPSA